MSGFPYYSLCVVSDPVYIDWMSLETYVLVLYIFEIFVMSELSKICTLKLYIHIYVIFKSREEGKDQESKQSSTIPDPGYRMGK